MSRLFRLKRWFVAVLYVIVDALCVGAGMGVPIFCILFGLVVGWYMTRRELIGAITFGQVLAKIFQQALFTSLFTFLMMAVIWLPSLQRLSSSDAALTKFGIPMILYSPRASFIGWIFLMVLISPCLQLLTTVMGSFLTLVRRLSIYETAIKKMEL